MSATWGGRERDLIRLVTVGNQRGEDLHMNRLEHTGLVHTDPADPKQAVTDSAAAATAFATGVKTFNGAIGVDAQGQDGAHAARGRAADGQGDRAGDHVAGHRRDARRVRRARHRSRQAERDRPPVPRGVQAGRDPRRRRGLLVPGRHAGRAGRTIRRPTRPRRARATRATSSRRPRGSATRTSAPATALRKAKGSKLLGLFANEELFEHREEGHGDLYDPAVPLPEMATKALDVLAKDRDGFFVLIEEEGIDEMAHENNAGLMIKAGAALDATVKLAVDFARKHPGTLIVVQGDHETGGLTIENPDTADESGEELSKEDGPFTVKGTNLKVFADWTTGQHTGADTPITASGPGSERFDGMIDNTEVHDAIKRVMR